MVDDTQALATRVSRDYAERIERATEQTDRSKSDIVAAAVRFYVAENPDGIPAFRPDHFEPGPLTKLGILPARDQLGKRTTSD